MLRYGKLSHNADFFYNKVENGEIVLSVCTVEDDGTGLSLSHKLSVSFIFGLVVGPLCLYLITLIRGKFTGK